ncbi:Exocyst complex component 1 [Gonapodya sp. JEL0774]|nr:Exocyst complex component 1 [Gonapodya sp. JEL0774]
MISLYVHNLGLAQLDVHLIALLHLEPKNSDLALLLYKLAIGMAAVFRSQSIRGSRHPPPLATSLSQTQFHSTSSSDPLRVRLIASLFPATDPANSSASQLPTSERYASAFPDERLLAYIKVLEEKKPSQSSTALALSHYLLSVGAGGSFATAVGKGGSYNNLAAAARGGSAPDRKTAQTVLSAAMARADDDSEDESYGRKAASAPGERRKVKQRYICVTIRSSPNSSNANTVVRLHKVKLLPSGVFAAVRSYGLDECKGIESVPDTATFAIVFAKLYLWHAEDEGRKVDFLTAVARLLRNYLAKPPPIINISVSQSASRAASPPTISLDADGQGGDTTANRRKPLDVATANPDVETDLLQGMLQSFFDYGSGDGKEGGTKEVEGRLRREVGGLEGANIHSIITSYTAANEAVSLLDVAIRELDEIDQWLNGLSGRLNNMGQDVQAIEAKNKGMQVQTTNQKQLVVELEKILSSLSLPSSAVSALRNTSLYPPSNSAISSALAAAEQLRAILNRRFEGGIGSMQVVQERMQAWGGEGSKFAAKVVEAVRASVEKEVWLISRRSQTNEPDSVSQQADSQLGDRSRLPRRGHLKLYPHDQMESVALQYAGLVDWLKEVDPRKHNELQLIYVQQANRVYRREIRDFMEVLRTQYLTLPSSGVPTGGSGTKSGTIGKEKGDDLPWVFTPDKASFSVQPLKSFQSAVGGAMNRSAMLGIAGRTSSSTNLPTSHRREKSDVAGWNAGRDEDPEGMQPDEAIDITLEHMGAAMLREQNFIVDLFGVGGSIGGRSTSPQPGLDRSGMMTSRDELGGSNTGLLDAPGGTNGMSPAISKSGRDVKIQKRMAETMEALFDLVLPELTSLVDIGSRSDPTIALTMLVRVEDHLNMLVKLSGSSGESPQSVSAPSSTAPAVAPGYAIGVLEATRDRCVKIVEKFVNEQVALIEETKVSLKRRTGVLSFIRTFPAFADRFESCIRDTQPTPHGAPSTARTLVNTSIERVVRKIFDSMDVIAKDVQQAAESNSKAQQDDKERLNVHILHLQVRGRKVAVLDPWVKQAKSLYDLHLQRYVKAVLRRPLGKLLEFFEGVEDLLRTGAAEEVSFHIQFNKNALKEVVRKQSAKEMKRNLEQLYKRVDKHFQEGDGSTLSTTQSTSGSLLQVVWRNIQEEFIKLLNRYDDLIARCWPKSGLQLEFSVKDMLDWFSEIARSH